MGNSINKSNFMKKKKTILLDSEIRKRLPKLQKLVRKLWLPVFVHSLPIIIFNFTFFFLCQDGLELPPQIGFDIETEDTKAPAPQASFFSDPAGIDIVKEFLQAFYAIYDSDDRQPLENAYHDQAMFSLTASYSTNPTYRWLTSIFHKHFRHFFMGFPNFFLYGLIISQIIAISAIQS